MNYSIRAGYVPSIGAGKKRFYLIDKRGIALLFWYSLRKEDAYEDGDHRQHLDVRTLPSKYRDGLDIENLSLPFKTFRDNHRQALKRAEADGFDFAAHIIAEDERDAAEAAKRQRQHQQFVSDDEIPF